MRRRPFWLGDASGAVAPTVALSLFALIGASGIAFDYARMAALDTELQNAADQAVLAAASQLDGESSACSRASAAAVGMVANLTYLANERDSSGTAVTLPSEPSCDATGQIRFYQNIGKTVAATSEDNARFVEVTVDPREVFFALTPVVAAFSSGDLRATAFAGLGQAICNTPPVMICNPSEPDGNINADYPFTAVEGDGVKLVVSSPQSPGDFGFLQTGYGTGASALARALGYNTPPADCAAADGVDTEPGDKDSVRAALNTRFDMSESGLTCPGGDANCSPSINSRKDLVKGNNCGIAGNQGWQEAANPYRPTSATAPLDGTNDPDIMGYPRDMCHAVSEDGVCGGEGIIGDGEWDRDAFFRVNYGWDHSTWMSNTGLDDNATRYETYKWEMDPANQATIQSASADVQTMANGKTGHMTPVCRSPSIAPNETTRDRRRISVAVVNCEAQGVNGRRYGVGVMDWMDVFLVEPAFRRPDRTTNGDIYVEVVGETQNQNEGNFQIVKKAVPYLIE